MLSGFLGPPALGDDKAAFGDGIDVTTGLDFPEVIKPPTPDLSTIGLALIMLPLWSTMTRGDDVAAGAADDFIVTNCGVETGVKILCVPLIVAIITFLVENIFCCGFTLLIPCMVWIPCNV